MILKDFPKIIKIKIVVVGIICSAIFDGTPPTLHTALSLTQFTFTNYT